MKLEDLGWDAFFADAFEPYAADNLIPARVSARHHGPCELLTENGRMGGLPAGKLSDEELPAVGDWVAARPVEGERKAVIEAVLPRLPRSPERKRSREPGSRSSRRTSTPCSSSPRSASTSTRGASSVT